MPAPTATPMRSASCSCGSQARICQRLDRRGDAVVDERIHLLDVFRRRRTSPDRSRALRRRCRVGNVLASKWVIRPMPLWPARMLSHAVATSLPTGLTMPSPVIDDAPLTHGSALRSSLIARVMKQPAMAALFDYCNEYDHQAVPENANCARRRSSCERKQPDQALTCALM